MTEVEHDEVAATLAAGRELGPEYADAVAGRLADKIDAEVDRRVEERMAHERAPGPRPRLSNNERLGLTITTLGVGFLTTAVLSDHPTSAWLIVVVWVAVALTSIVPELLSRRR